MERLAQFIRDRAKETYPEPRTDGHDSITFSMAEKVADYLPPNAVILDIGCGQGPALEWFNSHGFCAVGFALNQEDVDACREKGMPASIADMHDLPTEDGYADCVWARHVLEHSIAPFFALNEFARVLRPGGVLYIEVPAPDTSCNHSANRNHYSVLPRSMWMSLIERSGFRIVEALAINITTGVGPDTYWNFICIKTP